MLKKKQDQLIVNRAGSFISPKADLEYQKAYAWYEKRLEGLGVRFEQEVEKKLSSIASLPLLYPFKKFNVRECLINDFPYLIIYL